MKQECYLLTGCAGFIGSQLTDALLRKGKRIVGIDNFCDFYDPEIKKRNIAEAIKNPNFCLVECDIRNKEALQEIFQKETIDCVIHLAAMVGVRPSIEQAELYNEVNITGTLNILEAMKTANVKKIIFASSSSVYGNNSKVPFSEEDNVDKTISPYAATKRAAEVIAHTYHHLYEMDMMILRFFTVYGERQRPDLAIHKFTNLISKGLPISLYGDGGTERDYTYIEDILDGILKSLDYLNTHTQVYEILNLGESQTISLQRMVKTIEEAIGKKAIINQLPKQPGDVERTHADITKAKKLIGYTPQIDFEEGIKRFVEWFQNQNN